MGSYENSLKAEAASWVHPDTSVDDKWLRERIRHPELIRSLLLDRLPTHRMDVIEVGGGPWPLSDLLPFKSRVVIDPCTESYRKIAPCPDHLAAKIEDDPLHPLCADAIVSTNSLDHVEDWIKALEVADGYLRKGGFMAILCCENNSLRHPHPSHQINLTVSDIHRELDEKYETVHELTYAKDRFTYGWRRFDGRCGQPAFAVLMRKAYA